MYRPWKASPIVQVQGTCALVKKTGPDANDEEPEFEVKLAVLRHRIVGSIESDLWPGSYVGHPIAFIQPAGVAVDLWAYGLVTGYTMQSKVAQLHVLHNEGALRIRLISTSTVIAVDRLNYALRTEAFVNSAVLNALELLDKQNQVIVACGKSRSGLPTSVTTTMLSVPYQPDERVPLIRPDSLSIVHVRRQHIVDCELTAPGKSPADVFQAPDTDDETKVDRAAATQADIRSVRLHNRPLRKRARYSEVDSRDLLETDEFDIPVFETRAENNASIFRPSQVERQVREAIAHPDTLGKNDQAVLESAQQARYTKFLATPPVLRGAYDFSFGIRGLSLMHFRRFFEEMEMQKAAGAVNMTNFGRSNALQPATPPANIGEIVEAFNTLLYFAKSFYNATVYDFIRAGADFMEEYASFTRPDSTTCNMIAVRPSYPCRYRPVLP
ncbi:hypothetical protein PF005_g21373 [Phytophthora fragariae]|uniref:Uncharacterized protein n=1 Tax=Phytophthora fragariae TaxID=53985 RepID=A0A6A3WHM9_9STRA|nr:hypothetical protein PF005_g21373 [Phytophthora fragariae]